MNKHNPMLSKKRRERDISKLKQKGFNVEREGEHDIVVTFEGPTETLYEHGLWKIRVHLPNEYPYKSPSLGFIDKIYHPNIDFQSGSICLDVINQTWTPMYELFNIFSIFLPQLLTYPNPADPLNVDAAKLYRNSMEDYKLFVRKQVYKHAANGKELAQKAKMFCGKEIKEKINRDKQKTATDDNGLDLRIIEEEIEEGEERKKLNDSILSNQSQLSELSDTSGMLLEEDIFQKH